MSRRFLKQTLITSIFTLIIAGVVVWAYYSFRPIPSCSDNIQNQGEEKVDCGGPCPSCITENLQKIKVIWAEAMSAQDNFYDLVAQINNSNQNYGSGQIPFAFEIYDSGGNLINRYSGITYILPNQTKYLIFPKAESSQAIGQVKLSFGDFNWQKIENYQPPQLTVSQKQFFLSEETGFSQVKGLLINKSDFGFDKVEIDILLFDNSRHLLAAGTTEVRTLLVGQERDFLVSFFRRITGQVSVIEAEPETNIFDPNNFLTTNTDAREKFQEY